MFYTVKNAPGQAVDERVKDTQNGYMHTFEVEVKALLGTNEAAEELIKGMRASDPEFKELGRHRQLNHYFIGNDLASLSQKLSGHGEPSKNSLLKDLVPRAHNCSVRTRLADKDAILVIKASVDDTSSANGTARMEIEAKTPNLSLEQLDQLVLASGFAYQAKWSRERREFLYRGLNVSIDKNAGYGFLAEFEMIVNDPTKIDSAKDLLRSTLKELAISELPQDRLERMFAHYNKNWQTYYGTEKTFIVD